MTRTQRALASWLIDTTGLQRAVRPNSSGRAKAGFEVDQIARRPADEERAARLTMEAVSDRSPWIHTEASRPEGKHCAAGWCPTLTRRG
ncbi:hypothetical protein ACSCB1_36475 [Streptomyces europaeiscabiei]|uniref:hypothetical protein n=1 Tax=Streptomyces europaeiscabiei TaxID=146819 RepID=UPI000ADE93FB|nr:hypothetical protein [Streptomyces europaeiscabiei]MDX3665888.1 hypothetical protein [Streptomyces europaeiscabiei]MDX3714264.1 hypothetical protein [Streptomyces europaeiscabiei]MDX3835902.1 hypothetical protein [Streptomyces europaeiscabiei]MDX3861811.1 hypothetical protein [Streptomyces europaeiscabiei]MDX3875775.1 hypothetical protein [Streptomyces europaeiscabiei]